MRLISKSRIINVKIMPGKAGRCPRRVSGEYARAVGGIQAGLGGGEAELLPVLTRATGPGTKDADDSPPEQPAGAGHLLRDYSNLRPTLKRGCRKWLTS